MFRPFKSLRSKLIAAFAAVIAVSLLLASSVFAYIVNDYQTEREKTQLTALAMPISDVIGQGVLRGQSLPTIAARLDDVAARTQIRLLLIDDRGVIVHDTEQDVLAGRTFAVPPGPGNRRALEGTLTTAEGERLFVVVPVNRPGLRVALVQPEQTLSATWRQLVSRLSFAALSALLVSVALAWRLASSITRPLEEITRASEGMARGSYEHEVNVPGAPDEVGRLAQAFTIMAREVARSQRAMSDLLANVSHDLRTPLTSIQGFAGALVDGTLPGGDGAREAGRIIGEEAERMRRLIEDLLYLGRIESGELAMERRPVDLADVAQAAQPRFGFRAEDSGIFFRVQADAPVPILGDPHRLAQVLDNMLENAFKHTPPRGAITVTASIADAPVPARAVQLPQDGAKAAAKVVARSGHLTVHNTGSVIPEAEMERVFERFYQLDKARVGKAGRGLGLAIAREIVQGHGGTLTVASSPDDGTAFVAAFPMVEMPGKPALSSGAEVARIAETAALGRR